jgi:hypothetical protein
VNGGRSAVSELSSVTRITMSAKLPNSVGVPDTSPVKALREIPAGSAPEAIEKT